MTKLFYYYLKLKDIFKSILNIKKSSFVREKQLDLKDHIWDTETGGSPFSFDTWYVHGPLLWIPFK